ncbi:MAG TPA: hypothetical protein VD931_15345 [Baekduia sp.]|nr:hypothetical protein [Baekduia sp.]
MARLCVIADDGWVALDEQLCRALLESDHALHQLGERVRWAVEDAEAHVERERWRRPVAAAPEPVAA